MIVLPAIPAIVAALTPIVQAAAVAAGIGGLIGAGTGAVGCAISGMREHREINHEVAVKSARCAAQDAAQGALIGGAFGIFGPVIAPGAAITLNAVDDVAGAAFQVIDDAAKPLIEVVDDVAKPIVTKRNYMTIPIVNAADDATKPVLGAPGNVVRPALNKVGKAVKSVGSSVVSKFNRAQNAWNTFFVNRLPKGSGNKGYVYLMDDVTTPGRYKIGKTIDPPTRLKSVQSNLNTKTTTGGKVQFKCIISTKDMKTLEDALLEQFKPQNLPNFDAGTEWFTLTAAQVAAACSH